MLADEVAEESLDRTPRPDPRERVFEYPRLGLVGQFEYLVGGQDVFFRRLKVQAFAVVFVFVSLPAEIDMCYAVFFHHLILELDAIAAGAVIIVLKGYQIAFGHLDAIASRHPAGIDVGAVGRGPLRVVLRQAVVFYVLIFVQVGFYDRKQVILAVVVDQEYLQVLVGLGEYGCQRVLDIRSGVVAGDDDGYQWLVHILCWYGYLCP